MFGIKSKDCECCPAYANDKDDVMLYKYLCCKKDYQKTFDENVIKILTMI